MIGKLIWKENDGETIENEDIVQEVMEKCGNTGMWYKLEKRSTQKLVKRTNQLFIKCFTDKFWQKICDKTNLYAAQTNGTEMKCNVTIIEIQVYMLLYFAAVNIPAYWMAWA